MIGPFNHIGICCCCCCCNWLVNEMKDKVQSGMKELILIVSFFGLYRSNKGRTVFVCLCTETEIIGVKERIPNLKLKDSKREREKADRYQ